MGLLSDREGGGRAVESLQLLPDTPETEALGGSLAKMPAVEHAKFEIASDPVPFGADLKKALLLDGIDTVLEGVLDELVKEHGRHHEMPRVGSDRESEGEMLAVTDLL